MEYLCIKINYGNGRAVVVNADNPDEAADILASSMRPTVDEARETRVYRTAVYNVSDLIGVFSTVLRPREPMCDYIDDECNREHGWILHSVIGELIIWKCIRCGMHRADTVRGNDVEQRYW